MLQNAYLLAKIGADTAENVQHFAEILPIGRRVAERPGRFNSSAWRGAPPGAGSSAPRAPPARPSPMFGDFGKLLATSRRMRILQA